MYAEQSGDGREVLKMSEGEYLAFADEQTIKHEFCRGRVYAMTGGSVWHGLIAMNIGTHLNNQLRDRDCSVTSSDVRVHIASKRAYRYPDVTVFCGRPVYVAGRTDTITNPAVLVEVLSPGTALTDYNEKLAEYTEIESLDAYVLVTQSAPKVEVYRRYEAGRWLYENAAGLDAAIDVPVAGVEIRLSLAEIYRRVQWDADENEASEDTAAE